MLCYGFRFFIIYVFLYLCRLNKVGLFSYIFNFIYEKFIVINIDFNIGFIIFRMVGKEIIMNELRG